MDDFMKSVEQMVKPYRGELPVYDELPAEARPREAILDEMRALQEREAAKWREGYVSGAVYHGDSEHIDFLNRAYGITSQSNPLHSDLWPSNVKYEAEIVEMTASLMGKKALAPAADPETGEICGAVTSGGTESILLAMKAYRDRARTEKGITRPEMIVPVTAHAAFDKAARYFNIEIIHTPVDSDYRADVGAVEAALTENTIVIAGSAPGFPHGVIDPIAELSELARKNGIGFHTDCCLGGFVLPFAEELGYAIPPYRFTLPGVTSMSADTHKYGYAPKGSSVVLYRGLSLRRYQYFVITDWPGGLYFSPTFAGSRPGALSAACWAAMLSMGKGGYLRATEKILETGARIRAGIEQIPELQVLGDPLWVIAFGSNDLDIYKVFEYMANLGWGLNPLHKPACVHICVTLRHTRQGVAETFLRDLEAAVAHVKANPQEEGQVAPVYGLAATIPEREAVGRMLEQYIDLLYRP
jgi:glutamate/tyrosine decarboxylase-like PLP-dependent enzyme